MTSSIRERITTIRASLPPSVRLIAISKTWMAEDIRAAYAAGMRDFGENRIQEAASKQAELQDLPDITWHFIGRLQSNKAKKAIELFDWIHSVDNLKLAQRLNELAQQQGVSPQVCLQVKILPDPNKSGWTVPELLVDLAELDQCKNLQIQGLMTIPPLGLNDAEISHVFNSTYKLATEIQKQNWSHLKMSELSMGMSGDYQLAVQAGATMVRLGTILFGKRT
ncbi:YggS family pyridoxal phosphate-dependent enzyme [Nodularia sphaerocarpa]|uniref:YggS family pyridoxal phosphate-dependent enzyme n=1 Tax=Nodularia sphaerocarpa TaxID=137816 RepID=UPI001EFA89B1|nr:YggS family pyridoxal phosphate-dependent enzyme [Nodularia sphaerocarpa]MDB9373397.1 YggS family pyridoxal phosphate-dependent enzyme [Nodularia sphaerocarpa CS-585]MDB9376828.1 YggS family pyridoxal phosphate-dependent enzyme [Nodularia sphaerocarpa CS-585A2]ULP71390.1 Pyridoxal phosphate homeostasis protein [Nodularia sphaerocarpa UHCC 0038]